MSNSVLIDGVPSHWEVTTLGTAANRSGGDILTGPFGSQLYASDYVAEGIPSIMPKNIGDNRIETEGIARITKADAERLQRYRVRPGDIVYSRRGDVEKRALIRERESGWLCGTGCLRIRFGDNTVSPQYVSYYLGHPEVRAWIVRHAHGATMPNLNTSLLSALPFVIPPIEEQRSIARVLGTLDDKIELNRQMNQTLDEIARTLFSSWFVNFDPVWAKAEGRQPEGMDAETAALFPDRLVDSELGLIPDGWDNKAVKDVAKINQSTIRARDKWSQLQYIDISSTREGDISTLPLFQRGEEPSRARRRLSHGDTALSTVRPDRRSYFLALNPSDELVASTGFAVVTPSSVPWSFLHSALTQDIVFEKLGQLADGGAYPAVHPAVIGDMSIYVPRDERVTAAYHSLAAPIYRLAAENRNESRTLTEIRDSLLPRLISGQSQLRPSCEAE
jgi:type I restriction enzyme S subunit